MGHIRPTWKAFRAVNSSCHQRRKGAARQVGDFFMFEASVDVSAVWSHFIYVYACDTYVHAYIYTYIYIYTYCRIKSAVYKKRGIAQPINWVCGGLPSHQPDPHAVGGICRFYKYVDSDIVDMDMLIWVFVRTGPQYTYIYICIYICIYMYIYIYVYTYIYIYRYVIYICIMDTFGGLLTSIRTNFFLEFSTPYWGDINGEQPAGC